MLTAEGVLRGPAGTTGDKLGEGHEGGAGNDDYEPGCFVEKR